MSIKICEYFVLWQGVDSDGYELDILLQKRHNKKGNVLTQYTAGSQSKSSKAWYIKTKRIIPKIAINTLNKNSLNFLNLQAAILNITTPPRL